SLRNTFTVPQYKRVDIGFARVIYDDENKGKGHITKKIKDLKLSLEIFNLLNINNTLSYLWIKDLTGTTYAVPNYLTSRRLNLRLYTRF
ncbi:MAG: TonB-dependent receptor, partial [Bacteroidetes bacterium]|nr:TonB-dependent receptor [Bacteroidota bacterium]